MTRILCSQLCLAIAIVVMGAMPIQAEPSQTPGEWITADHSPRSEHATAPIEIYRPDLGAVLDHSMFFDMDEDSDAMDGEARGLAAIACSVDQAQESRAASTLGRLPQSLATDLRSDRFWLINTRSISHKTCCMNLYHPNFQIERLDACGRRRPSNLDDYLSSMDSNRPRFIYIHGNRRDAANAISQGLYVYQQLAKNRQSDQPFDWVIWSWPSEAKSFLLSDVREKAQRTDSQSLYVAWLLREHYLRSQPTAMIGFSFGGRIVSGSLHALAGGSIGRRTIGEPAIRGANIDVGLLAPAVDSTWMMPGGAHAFAPQNMNRLVLLYNQRDFALKYFRLIAREPRSEALGYTGPRCFAPRYDGTQLPVRAHDCAHTVGNHHSERLYYKHACYAGREMASLIDSAMQVD